MKNYPPCMEDLGGNRYRCRVHGWEITTTTLPIRCNCEARATYAPAGTVSVRSCATACYRVVHEAWEQAGRPTRSEEEAQRCLAVCRQCDQFGRGRVAGWLAMATFVCPQGRWR